MFRPGRNNDFVKQRRQNVRHAAVLLTSQRSWRHGVLVANLGTAACCGDRLRWAEGPSWWAMMFVIRGASYAPAKVAATPRAMVYVAARAATRGLAAECSADTVGQVTNA